MPDKVWYPGERRDELWHHGILGQAWGKKNGPPYPIERGEHSIAEKVASITGKPNYSVKKQKASELDDDALVRAIKRMENEKRYNDLFAQLNPKKKSTLSKILTATKNSSTHENGFIRNTFIKPVTDQIGKDFAEEITGKKSKEAERQKKRDAEMYARMEKLFNEKLSDVKTS